MARRRLAAAVAALVLVATACSDDPDDAGGPTSRATGTGPGETLLTAGTDPSPDPTPESSGRSSSAGSSAGTAALSPTDVADDSEPSGPPTSAESTLASIASTSAPAAPTTTSTTTTTLNPDVPPRVQAAAWTIYDVRQGEMLASNQAAARRPVGSLMKLLTAEVAYAAGQPTKIVVAPNDGLVLADDESVINIRGGQELSRDLLIRAMLKASANDAARLLAIDIAGSEAALAETMNATAAALGMNDTHAVNVTGLDADGQFSSAYDMTLLGARLMSTSINFQIAVRDPTAELNGQAYPNPNDLLGLYPGADGIKTGTTSGAGWCILASAIRDGRRVVVAVLGAPSEEARNAAAMTLLDWGFAQPG